MRPGKHSRTAEFMALFRALETARGSKERLFYDPWARGFLRPSFRMIAEIGRMPVVARLLCRFIDWRWPGARSSGVARTRYIDEAMLGALVEGIDQVVILGAGFDCRAYRLPQMRTVRVYEVDHPDTSRAKRRQVQRAFGGTPCNVRFVSVDFNREDLGRALQRAGLDLTRRVFFLWEGVTQYLDARAVDGTLRFVATAAPGGEMMFTYVDKKVLEPEPQFVGMKALSRALNEAAEPWVFGFAPVELAPYLEARGLKLNCDLGASEYRALYMKQADRFRGYEFYRVALAEVAGTGTVSRAKVSMTGRDLEHA
jgi:methyltransferase (TIGR00027 family)